MSLAIRAAVLVVIRAAIVAFLAAPDAAVNLMHIGLPTFQFPAAAFASVSGVCLSTQIVLLSLPHTTPLVIAYITTHQVTLAVFTAMSGLFPTALVSLVASAYADKWPETSIGAAHQVAAAILTIGF
jgi:hypothetical protein